MTELEEREYEAAEKCHICFEEFSDFENKKVKERVRKKV